MKKFLGLLAVGVLVCSGCSRSASVPLPAAGSMFTMHQPSDRFTASGRLLYVSDYNNGIVQVYNYPPRGKQRSPVATLTGFLEPQGMCVGDHDHVFIVNTGRFNVLEF